EADAAADAAAEADAEAEPANRCLAAAARVTGPVRRGVWKGVGMMEEDEGVLGMIDR
ncbi:hypothetical protein KEM56_005129, partial [Ascosphaera pollenicola]